MYGIGQSQPSDGTPLGPTCIHPMSVSTIGPPHPSHDIGASTAMDIRRFDWVTSGPFRRLRQPTETDPPDSCRKLLLLRPGMATATAGRSVSRSGHIQAVRIRALTCGNSAPVQ